MSLSQLNREIPFASLHLDPSQLYQKGFIVHIIDYNWTELTLCPVSPPVASMKWSVDCQRCLSVHLCVCLTHQEQWLVCDVPMNELTVHQIHCGCIAFHLCKIKSGLRWPSVFLWFLVENS